MSDYSDNSTAFEVTSKIMISAVIVFFVVMILVFLLHLYARCVWSATPEDPEIVSWRRQLARQNRPSDTAAAQRRQRGLNSSTLKSLPIAVYNPKEFKEGLECSICLSELQENEKVRILPNCNHGFHLDCIDKWFHSHSTCPICRAPVLEPVLDSNSAQQEEIDVNESGNSAESRDFPTNVLFWGDETQVRTSQEVESSEEVGSSGNSSESLVIDIPMEDEGCSNACKSSEEEVKSPVMSRMKSLKRLLSRGKKVSPSPCSSSSGFGDAEQV